MSILREHQAEYDVEGKIQVKQISRHNLAFFLFILTYHLQLRQSSSNKNKFFFLLLIADF